MRLALTALAVAAAALLSSCATQALTAPMSSRVPLTQWQDGDVLLVGGSGWRSWVVRNADSLHTPYSHAGLILIENGRPMLAHTTPVEGSRLIAVPLEDFLQIAELRTVAVYRSTDPKLAQAAAQEARRYVGLAVPFDDDYDLSSDSRLYCTEMIWRSYLNAGVDLLGTPRRALRSAPLYGRLIWPSDFTQMAEFVPAFSTGAP